VDQRHPILPDRFCRDSGVPGQLIAGLLDGESVALHGSHHHRWVIAHLMVSLEKSQSIACDGSLY